MANTKFATVQEASLVEISNDEQIDFEATIQRLNNAWKKMPVTPTRIAPRMDMYHCGTCGNYYYVDKDGNSSHSC